MLKRERNQILLFPMEAIRNRFVAMRCWIKCISGSSIMFVVSSTTPKCRYTFKGSDETRWRAKTLIEGSESLSIWLTSLMTLGIKYFLPFFIFLWGFVSSTIYYLFSHLTNCVKGFTDFCPEKYRIKSVNFKVESIADGAHFATHDQTLNCSFNLLSSSIIEHRRSSWKGLINRQ